MGFWGSKDVEDRAEEILDRRKQNIGTVTIDYQSRLNQIKKRLEDPDLEDEDKTRLERIKKSLERILTNL